MKIEHTSFITWNMIFLYVKITFNDCLHRIRKTTDEIFHLFDGIRNILKFMQSFL